MVMQTYISQSLPTGAILEYLICPSKTIFSFALPIYGSGTSTSASWVTSQPWYINTCFNNTCRGGQLASSMLRRSSEENVAPASNEKTRVPAGPRSVLNNNGELEGDRPHEKPEPLLVEVEIEGPRQAAEPHPVVIEPERARPVRDRRSRITMDIISMILKDFQRERRK